MLWRVRNTRDILGTLDTRDMLGTLDTHDTLGCAVCAARRGTRPPAGSAEPGAYTFAMARLMGVNTVYLLEKTK